MSPSGGTVVAVAAPLDDGEVNGGDVPPGEALLSQPEAPPPSQETPLN